MFGKIKQRMIDLEVETVLQYKVIDSLLQAQYIGKIAVRKTSGKKETISNAFSYKGEVRIIVPSSFDNGIFIYQSGEPIEHFEIVEAEKKPEHPVLDKSWGSYVADFRLAIQKSTYESQIKILEAEIDLLKQKLAKRNVKPSSSKNKKKKP